MRSLSGTLTVTRRPAISSGCPECGTIKKSGKRSCCARGGAWFKNCGDADDTKVDYTWAEGIRACNIFDSQYRLKSPEHFMANNVGVVVNGMDTTQSLNATKQHTDIYRDNSMSDAGVTQSKGCLRPTRVVLAVVVCIYTLFIL